MSYVIDIEAFDDSDLLDPRLKRRKVHDSRSRFFATPASKTRQPTQNIRHERKAPIWDQGMLGSCTANAFLGMLMTEPFHTWGGGKWRFAEPDCVSFYSLETRLDPFTGSYPPEDTGSAFLYAAKAGKQMKYIRKYEHAFNTTSALNWLVAQPINIGVTWYESMMETDKQGFVVPRGRIAGGHEICVDEINSSKRYVEFSQSWGDSWGPLKGRGRMTWETLDTLLRQDGDVGSVVT